ncbi:hypothetical protein HK405_000682, partial [Cladochytrium tenue]
AGNEGQAAYANTLGVPWMAWEVSLPSIYDDYEFWTDEDVWSGLATYAGAAKAVTSPWTWSWYAGLG